MRSDVKRANTASVGWVERSETHRKTGRLALTAIAALDSSNALSLRIRLQLILFEVSRKFSRTFNHAVDHDLAIELGQLENAVFSQFIFKDRGHDRYGDAHSPSSISGAL
jgi:hypothetical protein